MPDPKPKFNPNLPFEEAKPKFDPNQNFEIADNVHHVRPKGVEPEPEWQGDDPIADAIGNTSLSKTIRSGFSDVLPQTYYSAQQRTASVKAEKAAEAVDAVDYAKKNDVDFQRWVRDNKDLSWYQPFNFDDWTNSAQEFLESQRGLTNRAVELEGKIQQQKKEAARRLEGVVTKLEDIKSASDFTSYLGHMVGQGIYQIPTAAATGGTSSYLQESAAIYDEQLDKIANKLKLSREEVIRQGLDSPAVGQAWAGIAGALDATAAGKVFSIFRKAATGSVSKEALKNFLTEGTTEAIQGNIERLASSEGAGESFDPLSKENLLASANEFVGGGIGGASVGTISSVFEKNADAQKIIDEVADTGDPAINAEIDAAASLTDKQLETVITETQNKVQEQAVEQLTKIDDAIQKSETESVDVREQPADGEKMGEGDLQKETTQEKVKIEETPEYQEAVAKVTALSESIAQSSPESDITELYKQLSDAKQSLRLVRSKYQELNPTKEKRPRQEKSVKMTPAEALKKQIQDYYKGVEEGVKRGQKGVKENLVTKVQEAIKEYPLTPNQINTILTKVRKTNLFTPGSISKLNQHIDKVTDDAQFADNISEAENQRSELKTLSKSKVESIPVTWKTAAKRLSKIEPTAENIDEYRNIAAQVITGFKKPGSKQYTPINLKIVNKFVNAQKELIRQSQIDRLRDQFSFGDEITDEEVEQLINSPDVVEEEFYQNKENAKRVAIRDKVLRTAEYAKMALQESGKSNKAVETLTSINLNELGDGQLIDYIRTLDNIVENDDYTNSARIEAQAEALLAANELEKRVGRGEGEIGKFKGAVYNLPMLFSAIYSDSVRAALVQKYSRLQDIYNGGSRVEGQEHSLYEAFRNKVKEIKKSTGNDVLNADTQVRIGIFAPLVRYVKGSNPDEALRKSKSLVEISISRLKKKKDRRQLAEDAERLYQPFKNAKTIDEVIAIMKKVDPSGFEMWSFFKDKFNNEIRDPLKANSEEIFNEEWIDEENYTPKVIEMVDPTLDESERAFTSDLPGKPKQSNTAIAATNTLNRGQALNFEFYQNMFRKFRESAYDIEVSKPTLVFREFMKLPKAEKILGGLENKKQIIENFKKSEEIQKGIGKDYGDVSKFLDELTGTIRTLSYTSALGGIDQFVKQYIPVATNTMMNLGGDGGLFFSHIPKNTKLFDMYTIGQRGKRLGGAERGESTQYKIQSQYRNKLLKGINKIHTLTEAGSKVFMYSLMKGDVSVAKRSWAAYYLKYLKDNGVDLREVDLSTEHTKQDDKLRAEAAAYAEQKVKETQVVSNAAELARILRTSSGAEAWIKNIFLPFSTFAINTKVRLIENIRQVRTAPNKPAAYRALAGTVSEIALYSTVKYFVLSLVYDALKSGLERAFDLDSPGEEDKTDFKLKQWYTSILKDFLPTSIGTVGENATTSALNMMAYLFSNPDSSYEDWKKENKGGAFYQYENDSNLDLGLYSVGLDRIQELVRDTNNLFGSLQGEPVVATTPWGEKEIVLDDDQKRFLAFMVMMDFMGSIGTMDATFYNQVKRVYRDQLKDEKPSKNRIIPPRRKRIIRRLNRKQA